MTQLPWPIGRCHTDFQQTVMIRAHVQVILGRYARAEEVVVGTPLANRSRPELEGLIGYFVNSVALRADLTGALPRGHPWLLCCALMSWSRRSQMCLS